jgi:hypothetical protein
MKKAAKDYGLIFDSKMEKVIGVSLGFDFTAEHEWGIEGIREALGMQEFDVEEHLKKIKENKLGVSTRIATTDKNIVTTSFTHDGENYYVFYVDRTNCIYVEEKDLVNTITKMFGYILKQEIEDNRVLTAWSSGDICIVVGEEDKELPEKFKKAAKESNLFVGEFHDGNPFSNSSLTLFLSDNLTKDFKKSLLEHDKDRIKLERADRTTGIRDVLKKKEAEWRKKHEGRSFTTPWSYMALSPRWKSKEDTKYKVVYWLNPIDQKLINYGWYNVEELMKWVNEEDCSIVPKENWELLKWKNKNSINSMLLLFYEDLPKYEPVHAGEVVNYDVSVNRARQSRAKTFDTLASHILWIYLDSMRSDIKFRGKSITDQLNRETAERVFGIIESMAIQGLGYMGPCNTPKELENLCWLNDMLHHKAILYIAKEMGYITEEEEEKFLKPTLKYRN